LKQKDEPDKRKQAKKDKDKYTQEFYLVVVLVVSLMLLFGWVTIAPITTSDDVDLTAAEEIEYRKHSMSLILTAFGAWIAAGAAYFFGRESQKEQREGMLESQRTTPRGRLHAEKLSQFHLWELSWRVYEDSPVREILETLKEKPRYWFVPVLTKKGGLVTVLYHKAFYNFLDHHYDTVNNKWVEPYGDIMKKTVRDVIAYVNTESLVPAYRRVKLIDIYVPIKMDMTVGEASERMNQQDKRMAVVFDDGNKPTHFLDTNDIRRFLLSID
jgi:hypothetical protein